MPTPSMLDDKLRELALFPPTTLPVLSLYLNTQPDQHGRTNFDAFLRKESRLAETLTRYARPNGKALIVTLKRLCPGWKASFVPSSHGAAIFACAGEDDFFEALQFNAPIHINRLFVYHQPHLYSLAKLRDKYPPYAAVIADTNTARIFVFGLGRTLNTETVTNVKVRSRSQIGGWFWRRYQYQLPVENHHLRHSKEIVEQLDRIVREEGIEHIIFAGDEVILSVLRQQLPPFLSEKVVDELKLDITSAEHDVLSATLEAMREHDERTDTERVRAMIDDYRAGGLAVVGVHDVLAALANGQVDIVFVSTGLEQLHSEEEHLHEAIAPALKDLPKDTGMRITDALVTRAHQTGAQVRFIEDPALLADVGGVGASLRYQL